MPTPDVAPRTPAPSQGARYLHRRALRAALAALVWLAGLIATPPATPGATFTSPALQGALLVRHARLIDGTGGPVRPDTAILIRDGRIVAVGPDAAMAARADVQGVPPLDAHGATVVPGLVDAHVHLQDVIGTEVRGDALDLVEALRRRQLRSYLACGVTTVLDTAIHLQALAQIRAWLAGGEPGPSFLTLGPPIPPRGGYMSFGYPELAVARPEDLERNFAAIRSAGAFGVKVPIERGFGRKDLLPIHAPEVRAAIAAGASARGLPIFVHASDEEEQSIGLDMGAYALVHLNFGGLDPSPEFVTRMAATRTYVITTFSSIDAELARYQPERLDEPLTRIVAPREELESARNPDAWITADAIGMGYLYPWLPMFVRRFLVRGGPSEEAGLRHAVEVNLRAARTLHDRGVPIVIGSDAGNFVLAQFHGSSTLRELELLGSAGIPPADVLAAATTVPARMLHIESEVGTVEAGKRGDLVILRDDPLQSSAAFRSILWTVKSGVARTPGEWMDGARRP